jgi:hypothetical protein
MQLSEGFLALKLFEVGELIEQIAFLLLPERIIRENPSQAGVDGVFGVLQKSEQEADPLPSLLAFSRGFRHGQGLTRISSATTGEGELCCGVEC